MNADSLVIIVCTFLYEKYVPKFKKERVLFQKHAFLHVLLNKIVIWIEVNIRRVTPRKPIWPQ